LDILDTRGFTQSSLAVTTPSVEVVSRDRAGSLGASLARRAPAAAQVKLLAGREMFARLNTDFVLFASSETGGLLLGSKEN